MVTALTIAGSDCSGGAGIQADIKAMSANGVFAMSVIVSVVAENTERVIAIENLSSEIIAAQIDAVFLDIPVDAVKIGMLGSVEIMRAVSEKIRQYSPRNVVIDPVMYAKNGSPLMPEDSIGTLIRDIVPLADLLTPNIPETERITGMKINNIDDMKCAAEAITALGCRAALIKGGHSEGAPVDVLFDKEKFTEFRGVRINTKNTHGTGCTLSSAIAANLALGHDLCTAVSLAKEYVSGAIMNAFELGRGNGPTNHFYKLYEAAGINSNKNR